jgi:hypothetical protein
MNAPVRRSVGMTLRRALALIPVLILAGCGGRDEQPASPPAAPAGIVLTVRVDQDGNGPADPKLANVACDAVAECPPLRGAALADFAQTPADRICTAVFGGPETATVTGTWEGRRVDARFSRENGCEISRWEKLAALLAAP